MFAIDKDIPKREKYVERKLIEEVAFDIYAVNNFNGRTGALRYPKKITLK